MVAIKVKLPPALASQISAEARKKRVSKSALIRESLEKRYAREKRRIQPTIYERTKHLAGALKGNAPSDLSTNKKYMEGFGG